MKSWETKSGCKITQVLAGRSNVFLLSNGGKNILVDTSPGSRWKKLTRRLRRLQVNGLDALILTHAHYDHAGNAARVQEKYGAQVFVHRLEAAYLTKGENSMINGTNVFTRFIASHLAKNFAPLANFKLCRPDILVDAICDLAGFGFHAYIMPTPGHTAGSQSVIVDDEVAIVGDAMFGVFPGSVFPPYAEDAGQMVESWGKLLVTGCRLFLPAHGTADSRQLVQKDYNKRKRLT